MVSNPRITRISQSQLRTPPATLGTLALLPRPLIDPIGLQPEVVYPMPFGNSGVSNPILTHQKVMAPAAARKQK